MSFNPLSLWQPYWLLLLQADRRDHEKFVFLNLTGVHRLKSQHTQSHIRRLPLGSTCSDRLLRLNQTTCLIIDWKKQNHIEYLKPINLQKATYVKLVICVAGQPKLHWLIFVLQRKFDGGVSEWEAGEPELSGRWEKAESRWGGAEKAASAASVQQWLGIHRTHHNITASTLFACFAAGGLDGQNFMIKSCNVLFFLTCASISCYSYLACHPWFVLHLRFIKLKFKVTPECCVSGRHVADCSDEFLADNVWHWASAADTRKVRAQGPTVSHRKPCEESCDLTLMFKVTHALA